MLTLVHLFKLHAFRGKEVNWLVNLRKCKQAHMQALWAQVSAGLLFLWAPFSPALRSTPPDTVAAPAFKGKSAAPSKCFCKNPRKN